MNINIDMNKFDLVMKYVSIFMISLLMIMLTGKVFEKKLSDNTNYIVGSSPEHIEWLQPYVSERILKEKRMSRTISMYIHNTYNKNINFSNKIANIIVKESLFNNINPIIVASIIGAESSYRIDIRSYVGAVGLMQVMPFWKTYKKINIYGNRKGSLSNPEINIMYGTAILKKYLKQYNGNVVDALSAYNGTFGKMKYPNKIKRHFKVVEKYLDDEFKMMHNADDIFTVATI